MVGEHISVLLPVSPTQDHRINTECLGLEGTLKDHLAQSPAVSRDSFNRMRLLTVPSNLALNVSRDGASTTSLSNLGQCFTTLIVKYFFLIFSLNLLSFSLKPLPLSYRNRPC